jgi:hypothetical protein
VVRLRSAWLLGVVVVAVLGANAPTRPQTAPPTPFERNGGRQWTTFAEESAFLTAVAADSARVALSVIGMTAQGRPLHLVQVGHAGPHARAAARTHPTLLIVCTQHGNEPAGREACLSWLRDLAFTTDPVLVALLATQTVLFVPTANPDGRQANGRENSEGVDINRDHLGLGSNEARAIAAVVRDWQPDVTLDLHEYGPSEPVLYDDDILYLWPRNLNVDAALHDVAVSLALDHIAPEAEAAGYTADEYGIQAIGDIDVNQTAGDGDEGILRNTMGLRHSIGILVETATTPRLVSPEELLDRAAVARRRVASHKQVVGTVLRFMGARGAEAAGITDASRRRKTEEGAAGTAPVYFGGADNDPPAASDVVQPPPCGYRLAVADATALAPVLDLHGIERVATGDAVELPLGQPAEPVIPLLVDGRGARRVVSGEAMASGCASLAAPPAPVPAPAAPVPAPPGRGLPATGGHPLTGAALVCLLLAAAVRRADRGSTRARGRSPGLLP